MIRTLRMTCAVACQRQAPATAPSERCSGCGGQAALHEWIVAFALTSVPCLLVNNPELFHVTCSTHTPQNPGHEPPATKPQPQNPSNLADSPVAHCVKVDGRVAVPEAEP
jgi:hypothetical protein